MEHADADFLTAESELTDMALGHLQTIREDIDRDDLHPVERMWRVFATCSDLFQQMCFWQQHLVGDDDYEKQPYQPSGKGWGKRKLHKLQPVPLAAIADTEPSALASSDEVLQSIGASSQAAQASGSRVAAAAKPEAKAAPRMKTAQEHPVAKKARLSQELASPPPPPPPPPRWTESLRGSAPEPLEK